ncbi:hypothetical protein nbrc107696_01600 [Gordonia spumicola]|uniref:non-specific serine/threonine protein kinase n=1 Tax=Gordonia spumicola TaxID=589161 RepID=A0A7I9V3G4_9ACTN|nr:hypothetical protein [Gordonia spumicola]GED99713.1 hypothetical protein nbrc107696_01600 [Gordonia spumicola]
MTGPQAARIGGYEVVRRIGAGGMGQVYLVQHPRLPRQDALKLFDPAVSRDPDFRERFAREADVLAPLAHGNIVHLYEPGRTRRRPDVAHHAVRRRPRRQ